MERIIQVILRSKSTLDERAVRGAKDLYGEGIIDSLDILVIIDEISDEYGLDISAADFSREDFLSAATIWEMVKRLGGE